MISNQVLLAFPFLSSLSDESRRQLDAQAHLRVVKRGTRLINRGDRIGGLYLVVSGVLRVFTVSRDGNQASLYQIKAGESCLLAMNAIFAEILYPAWVVAESREVRLFEIPAATFKLLYEQEHAARAFVVRVLAERVFDLMSALEEISVHSLDERLSSFLIRRANSRREVETTHDEIAEYLATAREVVSRKLSALNKAGVIRTKRGRITLLRPDALNSRANGPARTQKPALKK